MNKEEGRIIKENPLRILGVFSDTPKKEIVANLGKLRAFAKTGKTLDFDTDFTTLLGPVARTIASIEKANNDIALPKDKLQAGMFWFMQHTDNDRAAIECLKLGNPDEALTIMQKEVNYSGVVNMAVLALILKRWDIALYSYANLLESPMRRGALIKAFTDTEDFFSEDDLVEYITNKLIHDFPNANWIDQIHHENVELGKNSYPFKSRFEGSKLLDQLSEKCVLQIKKEIDSIISEASSVSKKDAMANLAMAKQIEERCKPLLKELRIALGKDDKVYIEYADNVANQILDNCIDYYTHDTNNLTRARNVIKYTRYAYRTAEGKTSKERAKKNLDILTETLEHLIPDSMEKEFNAIDKLVNNYKEINAKMDYSDYLGATIDNAYSLLISMKDKINNETENKHYISISSNFVIFAIHTINTKISSVSNYSSPQEKETYKSTLLWGRELLDKLAKFKKDDACNNEYNSVFFSVLSKIRKNGLLDLGNSVHKAESSSSQLSSEESSTNPQTDSTQSSTNPQTDSKQSFNSKKSSNNNKTHGYAKHSTYYKIKSDNNNKWHNVLDKVYRFSTRDLPKYLITFSVLYLYYLLCRHFDFHWTIKLGCIIPTTVIFWLLAKYLPPKNYDGPIEITGQYEGGGFEMWNGFGVDVVGHFGYPDHFLSSNFNTRNSPHRSYVFFFLWIPLIPIDCISVSQGETQSTGGYGTMEESKTSYRIYGTCKWSILEVIYLYLFYFSCIAGGIDVLYYLGTFIDYLKS